MRRVYSCSRKSKGKWYMRLFWFLVDTSVVNAYILECESPNRPVATSKYTKGYRTQLKCILELAKQLKEKHCSCQQGECSYPAIPREFQSEERYSEHVRCQYPSPWQCKVCTTHKRTSYECAKCSVPLCIIPCFGYYHSGR